MSFDQAEDHNDQPTSEIETHTGDDGGGEFDPSFVAGRARKGNSSMAILGGLLLAGAVTIWFVFFRGGPQAAQGGMSPNDGGSQIKQFLDSGNINMMKQTLKETEKIVKQFRAYPGKTQVPLDSLHTNPFRELEAKADAPVVANNVDAEHAEELHKQAIAAVAELHLQSVMRGSKVHACMINNTFYREGQQIGALKLEQVNPNGVVVSSGPYRFEVKMKD